MRYTADQQLLIERYDRLSSGHKHVVDNLIDTLDLVEAAESCPNLHVLRHFDRQLAAGIGDPSELIDEGENVYVYSSPEVSRADSIFTVNGDSMEPEFHSGQEVLVQQLDNGADLLFGEIGAFIIGNETYIKEYQEDGLYSLNPDYPPMHFQDEDRVYLIGRVLGVFDKEQYAKPSDIQKYQLVHGEE